MLKQLLTATQRLAARLLTPVPEPTSPPVQARPVALPLNAAFDQVIQTIAATPTPDGMKRDAVLMWLLKSKVALQQNQQGGFNENQ